MDVTVDGKTFGKLFIRALGANVARVKQLLSEAKEYEKNQITCYHVRKYDEDIIEIIYDESTSKMMVDELLRTFAVGLDSCIYAIENISLEEQVIALLKVRRKRISVAESFTGGGLAKRLVSVSGASEVYFEGLNTYNENAKIKRLGVSPNTLRDFGAVSEQTAYEMALGLLNTGDCDVAVATTGLAGPKTDASGLPIGLCYLAVGTREKICVYRYHFDGDRQEITEKAINYALYLTYKRLKDI